jgi:preprotein translocase subunit YajC
MNFTSNKWFLPILIIIIIILSGYFIVDYYNHLTQEAPCDNQGNGIGSGGGQGRNISNVYNLLIAFIIIIIILIPILYFLITRNIQNQMKENKKLISEITESNKKDSISQNPDKSQKLLLLKFLNYGENQVIKKLIENKGTILQSEISRMPNMGKVRTHRIITELKKKEIITIEKYGKTNRINLSEDAKSVLLK